MVGRYMGLDVGDRTVGIAVSDALGLTAQPVGVLRRDGRGSEWQALAQLVQQYEPVGFVVGWPRNMNGSEGPRVEATRAFEEELKARFGLPIHREDERLTTRMAQRTLLEADVSRKKRKGQVDKLAASIILQGFLDRGGAQVNL